MEKDNRGYSLVEVIIVVAIIAAVVTTAMLSVSLIFNANAKTCANDIMGAISECKIMTMSKGQNNVRLILYRDGANGNIFYELQTKETGGSFPDTPVNPEKVGTSKCMVGSTEGGNDLSSSPGSPWAIVFNRSTGALESDTSSEIYDNGGIYVVGGNRRYYIKIDKLTGKQSLVKLP